MSDEVDKLHNIIRRLDEKLKTFSDQVQSLKEELTKSHQDNDEASRLIDNLSEELEKRTVEVNVLSIENRNIESELQAVNKSYNSLKKEYAKAKDQLILQFEVEHDNINETMSPDQLRTRNKLLELTLVKLREESLDNELKLSEKVNSLTDKVSKYETRASMQTDLGRLNEELQAQLENLQKPEELIENLTLKNQDLITQNEKLAENVKELEELESLNQELIENHSLIQTELKQEVSQLEKKLREREQQIDELDSKIQKLEKVILRLNAEKSGSTVQEKTSQPIITEESIVEVHEMSSKKFNEHLDNLLIREDNFKIGVMKKLVDLSTLTSYFFERVAAQVHLGKEERHLKSANCLFKINAYATSLLEVYKFKSTVIPHEIVEQIDVYLREFVDNYKEGQLELDIQLDLISCDDLLRGRELAIIQLSTFSEELKLGLIVINNLEGFKVGQIKENLSRLIQLTDAKLTKLISMRAAREGVASITIDVKPLHIYLCNLIATFDSHHVTEDDIILDAAVINQKCKLLERLEWRREKIPVSIVLQEDASKLVQHALVKQPETNNDGFIDKLNLKIGVLEARLKKLQINEEKLTEVGKSLEDEHITNENLVKQVTELKSLKEELQDKINHMNKLLNAFGLDHYNHDERESKSQVHEEFHNLTKNRMINEIAKQRDLIERLSTKKGPSEDYSWLEQDISVARYRDDGKTAIFIDGLFDLALNFIAGARTISKQKHDVAEYYAGIMEEKLTDFILRSYGGKGEESYLMNL
ncbi:hypothetical protein FOA43_000166 [Brettanomyces nanus]|uniref:Uncharacterized protein n=1 Tax=Eeniella nana TaxID=13502 RepID=A0A875S080_EENNA|nr:uncharacterized protein FOA43_000166 [Brettanomyces nanus]QPG72864.1 hypothetical protein FOA43_000166 [Brettanomyces nanus]